MNNLYNNLQLPTYKEIPDVGLYLDQTSKLINQYLQLLPNCSITNSMISNYVKQKLISNPIKKQYYRDQIAQLIIIVISKNTLSLENVAFLLKEITEKNSLEVDFDFFMSEIKKQLINEDNTSKEDLSTSQSLILGITKVVIAKIHLEEKFNQLQ